MGTSAAVTVLIENEKPEGGGLVVDVELVVDGTVVATGTVVDADDGGTDELERVDPPEEPQEAAATRITVSSAYGIRERREGRKEVEADILAERRTEPRALFLPFPVASIVLLTSAMLLGSCSAGGPRDASRVRAEPVTWVATSTSVAAPASTSTSHVPPSTAAPRPATTVPRTTTTGVSRVSASSVCAPSVASGLAWTGSARQLVTVESQSYASQTAAVTLWQRSGSCWAVAGGPWSGFIGYNGFADHKREGDGRTPAGSYGFAPVIYGNAPDPGVHESYHRLVCGDWWDENPSTSSYNTFQHVNSCSTTSPWAPDSSSEALWTEAAPYPSFAVIDYNTGPVTSGAGSAIFLHASTGGPTSGCVSIPVADLDQFLRWMQPADSPLIVMGPASEIARF